MELCRRWRFRLPRTVFSCLTKSLYLAKKLSTQQAGKSLSLLARHQIGLPGHFVKRPFGFHVFICFPRLISRKTEIKGMDFVWNWSSFSLSLPFGNQLTVLMESGIPFRYKAVNGLCRYTKQNDSNQSFRLCTLYRLGSRIFVFRLVWRFWRMFLIPIWHAGETF